MKRSTLRKSNLPSYFSCALLCILAVSQNSSSLDAKSQSDTATFNASKIAGIEEAYLPKLFRSSHAANLLKLYNGDLLCFWFSGTEEGQSKVAIVMSRLANSSRQWSQTIEIDHRAERSFQNPVAFQLPSGRIWLIHTSQPAGKGQANADVLYLTSDNFGRTWTNPRPLFKEPGSFVRQPPLLVSKNDWLLPIYYTPGLDITHGAELNYSAVEITSDAGKTWRECRIPDSNGLVQPDIVRFPDGRLLAFLRSRYADFVYKSTSTNGCDWTPPVATQLPNNNSSFQVTVLHDGALVIAFNNSSAGPTRDKPRTSVRKPLSIALSRDGGETWPWVRDIEIGSSIHSSDSGNESSEEYSYPSVIQDADEQIYVAYTYLRKAIKLVRFHQEWIKQGHTQGEFKGDSRK